ncbi:kinase-like domain-containing protein [Irpex lacteus]|nr:kinase-like domain-containing protein [Irpex lacteus]
MTCLQSYVATRECSKKGLKTTRGRHLTKALTKVKPRNTKKAYREQSIPRAIAVRELLEYVCQEDRSHPAPDTNIMGQYERYRRPFTAALASPRGYERENVWNTIVETMKDTSDKAIRITCSRALGRLLEGLRLRGRFATVLRGKLDRNSSQLYAFRQSLQLEKLLRDPISRPKLFLEFISWRYIDHPRLLPFLGILPVELVQKEEFSTVLVFPWQAEHAASKKNRKRIAKGMEYLHSMGIVHGNLKAANIFLNEDQHVLISDYGTWHLADGVQGKLQWSAPELLDMQHADLPIIPTEKSDVWSFACLCVEVIVSVFFGVGRNSRIATAVYRSRSVYRS